MISPKYVEEETKITDLVKHEPVNQLYGNTKKHVDYVLREDKVLDKIKGNLERGGVLVKKTPKGGALMVYMDPGDFKIVMDKLVMLKVGQKFTIGNVNIHVSEHCAMEENTNKNVHHKLVLRLNRRTFPTSTTSPTLHIYPTLWGPQIKR